MKKLILATLAAVGLAGCPLAEQPPPPCLAGHGTYGVKYTKTSTADVTGTRCDRHADMIGVEKYQQEEGPAKIALRPIETIGGGQASRTSDVRTIALGTLEDNYPDPETKFCSVATWERDTATESLGGAPPTQGTLTYKFSNVNLYVTAAIPGTQLEFDVTIADSADTCSATYHAIGLFPLVGCWDLVVTEDVEAGTYTVDKDEMDQAMCAGVDHVWSGGALNPTFDATCVADETTIGWTWPGHELDSGDMVWASGGAFCVPTADTLPSLCPEGGCAWRPTE